MVMRIVINLLALIGDWLLFTFPVYQAGLELEEYEGFIEQYRKHSAKEEAVSPLWWLAPFYKINREKRRAMLILHQTVHTRREFDEAFSFLNKATAWWYVALAGLLGGIHSLYELVEAFEVEVNWWLFVLTVIVLVALCLGHVVYRLSGRRRERMYRELLGE